MRQHRNVGHLGLSLNVLFLNVPNRAVPVLRQTGFHDLYQDCFFGENSFNVTFERIFCKRQNTIILGKGYPKTMFSSF